MLCISGICALTPAEKPFTGVYYLPDGVPASVRDVLSHSIAYHLRYTPPKVCRFSYICVFLSDFRNLL